MNGSRRLLLWAVVTLGWIAILLPMTAPAGLFAYLIERGSNGRLQLVQPVGSLWGGQGQLTASPAYVSDAESVELRWHTLWPAILRGSLEWRFLLAGKEVLVGISPGGWSVDSPGVRVPIDLVRAFLPALVSRYTWRGDIQLQARAIKADWADVTGSGTARLELRGMGVKELLRSAAGSYSITTSAERGAWSFVLDTLEGPLQLKGTGRVADGRLACAVEAKVAPGGQVELSNLMDHIARREAPGSWALACR
jgi:general secretion pathway protein N